MILEGRLYVENVPIAIRTVTHSNPDVRFSMELEETLIILCRELEIPTPMWLSKSTHEFAAFKQTLFFADQYNEDVKFDRFQMKLIES